MPSSASRDGHGDGHRPNDADSTRPPTTSAPGYVRPQLADWAHLVVEPSDPSHGSVFLGPQQAAGKGKLPALRGASPPVVAIVNCTNAFPNHHEGSSIAYCRVAVNDECGANLLLYLEGAARFVRHHILRGGSVLVHCQMGVSRSATVVIAYLMRYLALSREEAYARAKRRRPMIGPNRGFWKQLELYGQRLRRERGADEATAPTVAFDKDWASRSLASYATVGRIANDPSELFREITDRCDAKDVVYHAVDFVFGRGILEADLPWFSALCASFRAVGVEPRPFVDGLFEEGSDFVEMWSGEVYPQRIERVKAAAGSAPARSPGEELGGARSQSDVK